MKGEHRNSSTVGLNHFLVVVPVLCYGKTEISRLQPPRKRPSPGRASKRGPESKWRELADLAGQRGCEIGLVMA